MPRIVLLVMVLALAGCGTTAPTTPPGLTTPAGPATSAGPASSAGGLRVRQVIDTGGGEVLGLAIHGDAVWAVAYDAGAVVKIDPASGRVVATVTPGPGVASVLSAGDSVWVAAYGGPGSSRLYRIDPGSARVVASIDTGEVCCDLSAGGASIWAVDPNGAVLRVDPARNVVAQRFPVGLERNVHVNAVYAGDSVWVSSDPSPLTRIRISNGSSAQIATGGGVPFVARDGLVWGAAATQLWAVDQMTGAVVRTVALADSIEVLSLNLDADSIWVGIRRPGRVGALLRLDSRTGQVRGELRDIQIPARIEIGFGSVWVTDSGSRAVYRVQV